MQKATRLLFYNASDTLSIFLPLCFIVWKSVGKMSVSTKSYAVFISIVVFFIFMKMIVLYYHKKQESIVTIYTRTTHEKYQVSSTHC